MDAFASVEDLEAGWRELDETEKRIAETLLMRASTSIRAAFRNAGAKIDSDDQLLTECLKDVSCSMVRRHMNVDDDAMGATQWSQTAGNYTMSMTMSNNDGVMRLTSAELDQLGLSGKGCIKLIPPKIGGGWI